MRLDMERALARSDSPDGVLLLGSRGDVADLLAASDVLLSVSRMEGMPANLIEAGMSGTPVVGFDIAGTAEVVVDGETGFLVPWGDSDMLKQRLHRLLGDSALRAAMGKAARARCRSMFDIEVIAPRYLQLYEELVGRQPVSRAMSEKETS
jgi:N,N'-diacetylbacillosaminyl-diphospho-undecaprenol alpha-1,3-N-acetylgalactosaminyltransferase